jgi:hypothetical protein
MAERLRSAVEWLIEHTLERSKYWALLIAILALAFSAVASGLGILSTWKTGLIALGGVVTAATGIIKIWEFVEPRARRYRDVKTLKERLGAQLYSAQDILDATKDYM